MESVSRPLFLRETPPWIASLLQTSPEDVAPLEHEMPSTLNSMAIFSRQSPPWIASLLQTSTEQDAPLQQQIIPEKFSRLIRMLLPREKPRLTHAFKPNELHFPPSVLSACGKVPTSFIVDIGNGKIKVDEIDLPDIHNPLVAVEYLHDLYTFYNQQQNICRPIDYISNGKQTNITADLRAALIGWLILAHQFLGLPRESLYLAIQIIDRYLSVEVVPVGATTLLGISAFWIALKYEEDWVPRSYGLIRMTGNKYTTCQIAMWEKEILNKLGWYLTVPTSYTFLLRYAKAAKADKELEHMIYFLGELALMEHRLIPFSPSMVAASAVYTARCTLRKYPLWNETLQRHTSYSVPHLLECAQILVQAHANAPSSWGKLKLVYDKYMGEEFGRVALYPPAMRLF